MRFFILSAAIISLNINSQDLPIDLEDLDKDLIKSLAEKEESDLAEKPKLYDFSIDNSLDNNLEARSNIFGFDYIKSIPQSISSTSDLPVPNDFVVSLGDELRVILTGGKNDSYTLVVGMDGSILIPELGALNIFGESFSKVKKMIQSLVEVSYVGTDVSVSLKELKAKKINIIGAVKNPGIYIVNPFSTISSSLAYAGGFEDYASLRNITLIRGDDKFFFDLYDLLIFGDRKFDINIQQGDTIMVSSTSNFVEVSGEVLRPFIYEYKSSDTYKELIYDFSLGLTRNANENIIYGEKIDNNLSNSFIPDLDKSLGDTRLKKLKILKNSFKESIDIQILGNGVQQNLLDLESFNTLDEVISLLTFSDNIYPFYANLEQYSPLALFREKHSFSLSDPSTYKGIVLNKNPKIRFYSREDIEDIQKLLEEESENEKKEPVNYRKKIMGTDLTPDLRDKEFDDELYDVSGEEISEDEMNFKENQGIKYVGEGLFFDFESTQYITFDQVQIRQEELTSINDIFSSISKKSFKNFYYSEGKKVLPIEGEISPKMITDFYGIAEDHNVDSAVISLKDGNVIAGYSVNTNASLINSFYIPEISFDTRRVTIKGLVNSPGVFDVPVGTTLNDLYLIADGFLVEADKDSIIFTRENIKESERQALENSKQLLIETLFNSAGSSAITGQSALNTSQIIPLISLASEIEPVGRLTGDLSQDSSLAKTLVLEDGDEIEVIPKRNIVTVTGQVLQPVTVSFDAKLDVRDYISIGGGFSQYADKNNVYLIKKNGTSMPLNNRLFSIGYKIQPGDTIVVPRDMEYLSPIPLVSVATSVISDIAFAAASLNSLRN